MLRARLTSKGQVTIPVEVRRRLDLQAGDELIFEPDAQGIRLLALKRKRLSEFYAMLPVSRPYPGKERVREEVSDKLAHELLNKEHRG